MSSNLCGRIISSVFEATKLSDHKIIRVKYAMNIDKGPGMWIFNETLLNDTNYTQHVDQIMDDSLTLWSACGFDAKYFWDMIKQKSISFTK